MGSQWVVILFKVRVSFILSMKKLQLSKKWLVCGIPFYCNIAKHTKVVLEFQKIYKIFAILRIFEVSKEWDENVILCL